MSTILRQPLAWLPQRLRRQSPPTMTTMRLVDLLVIAVTVVACDRRANVECLEDPNCNLTTGGVCAAAATGNRWCAYPDPACASGYRFSDEDVGDGVSGACVAATDAGTEWPMGNTTCKLRVVFDEGPAGTREVWVANPDGSEFINLSNHPTADDAEPAWSPNGLRIAFESNRTGHYDIWAVNVDGTGLVNLTPNGDTEDVRPIWSPDGTRIAFLRNSIPWVMNSNGTNAVQVTTLPVYYSMEWSPDGSKLIAEVYDTRLAKVALLYIISVNGTSSPIKLTSNVLTFEIHPLWGSTGEIFWSDFSDIFEMNSEGGALANITQNAQNNGNAQLTEDGSMLVFSSTVSGSSELWSMPSTGGPTKQLTRGTVAASGSFPTDISSSSDGSLVAYEYHAPGNRSDVGIVGIDGGGAHTFNAPRGSNAHEPSFSHCPGH